MTALYILSAIDLSDWTRYVGPYDIKWDLIFKEVTPSLGSTKRRLLYLARDIFNESFYPDKGLANPKEFLSSNISLVLMTHISWLPVLH